MDGQTLRGSCLCGGVGYEIHGTPLAMYCCHCSMCRKATGSAFATNMLVAEADFVVTRGRALIRAFQSSPGEWRHFCSVCGSPLYSMAREREGVVSVRCGTLDDDPPLRPQMHIHTASKAPWCDILDAIPRFTAEPDA